jgi:hypothetical protein
VSVYKPALLYFMNIAICNACGKEHSIKSPNVGYFCEARISVEIIDPKTKNAQQTIQICKGVVVLHRGNGSSSNPPTQRSDDSGEVDSSG